MRRKVIQGALVTCLFVFLFIVVGGGLRLNPGGAFLAAATGTPLVLHAFNRWASGLANRHTGLPDPATSPAGSSDKPQSFEHEGILAHD